MAEQLQLVSMHLNHHMAIMLIPTKRKRTPQFLQNDEMVNGLCKNNCTTKKKFQAAFL